jgi:hypothetical protein
VGGIQVSLSVQIAAGPISDREELNRLSSELRCELLELDVDSVSRASNGSAPANAKTGGTGLSDVLIVSLSNSTVLVSVLHLLGLWIKRGRERRVKLKVGDDALEIDSASTEEVAQVIESWLDRLKNN